MSAGWFEAPAAPSADAPSGRTWMDVDAEPLDTLNLTRKDAKLIQTRVAYWIRANRPPYGPKELGSVTAPAKFMMGSLVLGTVLGQQLIKRLSVFQPTGGPPSRAWGLAFCLVGFPLSQVSTAVALVPSMRSVLQEQTPISVQARHVYRCILAERSGAPPPPEPPVLVPVRSPTGSFMDDYRPKWWPAPDRAERARMQPYFPHADSAVAGAAAAAAAGIRAADCEPTPLGLRAMPPTAPPPGVGAPLPPAAPPPEAGMLVLQPGNDASAVDGGWRSAGDR